jgi:soluble lytic murein transglycosylase-like protein
MNKTILGVAVVAGLALLATASNVLQYSDGSNEGGESVPYWKTNEYPKYAEAIRNAENENNIPRDGLARLLYQESRFRADVISGAKRSPVGAIGIAQFMPATGVDYGLVVMAGKTIVRDDRTNPYRSIAAAGRYLHDLYRMFNDWNSALMAYNWGPGNVLKYNRGEEITVPLESSQYVAQITADVQFA